MSDTTPNLLTVKNLHKYFHGTHVLKGINLEVGAGKLISIIGRSGCGKTTFLRCLNCLEIMDSGTINIAGISLNRVKAATDENGKPQQHHRGDEIFGNISQLFEVDEDFQIKMQLLRTRVGMLFQNLQVIQTYKSFVSKNDCKK